jgi:hypothetical protein
VLSSSVVYPRNDADNADPFTSQERKGRKKPVEIDPKRHLDRDQAPDDLSVGRLLAAKSKRDPIVLIVGSNYRWWPLMMNDIGADSTVLENHDDRRGRYAVLGWYLVRDAWQELEPGKADSVQSTDGRWVSETALCARWRFSFQWIEEQGTPWWVEDLRAANTQFLPSFFDDEAATSNQTPISKGPTNYCMYFALKVPVTYPCIGDSCDPDLKQQIRNANVMESQIPKNPAQVCASCFKISPRIYHNGWFCTNSSCTQFSMVCHGFTVPFTRNF